MGPDTYKRGQPRYAPHSIQALKARSRANVARHIRQIDTADEPAERCLVACRPRVKDPVTRMSLGWF